MNAHTAPRFPASAYRSNAALHMSSARHALTEAQRHRRHGGPRERWCSIVCSNAAQFYRLAYLRRMRQAAIAAQAEYFEALSLSYFRQAEDQPEPGGWARYCYQLSSELNDKATATYNRAFAAH